MKPPLHEIHDAGDCYFCDLIREIWPEADRSLSLVKAHERFAQPSCDPAQAADPVNHPKHYNSHPSGVECITVARHFGFNLGNVIKYLWRAEEKGAPLEDLKKARWYLDDEIQLREERGS